MSDIKLSSVEDFNALSENILLGEENLNVNGYDDGYSIGKKQGNTEGFHLGFHRGAELGAELGYYLGVTNFYITCYKRNIFTCSEKAIKHLKSIKEMIENFPRSNTEDIDILSLVDSIRAQFKRTCALIKINGVYPDNDKSSF